MRRRNGSIPAIVLTVAAAIYVSACAPARPPRIDPLSESRADLLVAALRDVNAGTWVRLHLLSGEQAVGQLVSAGYVMTTIEHWVGRGWRPSYRVEETYESKHVLAVEVLAGDPLRRLGP